MKRLVSFALVASAVLAFAATASADNNSRRNKNFNASGKSGSIEELILKFTNRERDDDEDDDDDDDRRPIDPGPGDGTNPPSNPTPPQPQGRPGFVWVGDHWEREKAGQTYPTNPVITDPLPGNIVVRDHRKPYTGTDSSSAPGGVTVTNTPIIRDHRTGENGPIIRDHRAPSLSPENGQGGVWVTETTGKPRPKGGGGGGLLGGIGDAVSGAANGIGNAVGAAGNAVGNAVGDAASTVGRGAGKVVNTAGNAVGGAYDSITPASKKPSSANTSGWTVVRDHR
jgi:hypothetical protein